MAQQKSSDLDPLSRRILTVLNIMNSFPSQVGQLAFLLTFVSIFAGEPMASWFISTHWPITAWELYGRFFINFIGGVGIGLVIQTGFRFGRYLWHRYLS